MGDRQHIAIDMPDEDYGTHNNGNALQFANFAFKVGKLYMKHQYPRTYKAIKYGGQAAVLGAAGNYVRKTFDEQNKINDSNNKMPRIRRGIDLTNVSAAPSRRATLSRRPNIVLINSNKSKGMKGKKLFIMDKSVKKPLKKQVKDLQKKVASDQAYHTHRTAVSGDISSANAQSSFNQISGVTVASLESACANLRYYDPATPGTLVTANASTGTYSRVIHFSSVNSKLEVRNNYQVPCKVRVYLATPKQDTSITPLGYYTDGITDQVISGVSTTPLLYPTDIDLVNKAYKLDLVKNRLLEPGQQITVSQTVNNIDYNPAMFDTHNLSYQKKYKNFIWVIRLEGCLGHEATADEQGISQCEVDYQMINTYKIIYDAGTNLNDISYADSRTSTFTGPVLLSNKPVSDNQSYSAS